jgi:hypothetical protein
MMMLHLDYAVVLLWQGDGLLYRNIERVTTRVEAPLIQNSM